MNSTECCETSAPLETRKAAAVVRRDLAARQPLAVELLASEDQRRLTEALDTRRPLPASNLEECHRFDDDLAADPLVERFGRPRKERQANRVLAILDQLERSRA